MQTQENRVVSEATYAEYYEAIAVANCAKNPRSRDRRLSVAKRIKDEILAKRAESLAKTGEFDSIKAVLAGIESNQQKEVVRGRIVEITSDRANKETETTFQC